MRWNNMHVQRQIKGLGLGELTNQPKAIEINLDEIREIQTSTGGEYQNPFARIDPLVTFSKGADDQSQKFRIDVDPKASVPRRKWKADISEEVARRIQIGRADYEKYLKLNNNTSNREVWKVYDHLAADLMNELLAEILGTIDRDLDKFCEKVIFDEFNA